ncbi:MAG: hypothetical protein RJS98_06990 [Rhodospirillaceae bacterium]
MNTSEKDIYITANLLIAQHGEDAILEASSKIDEMLATGDLDGRSVWLRILNAIKELQCTTRTGPFN